MSRKRVITLLKELSSDLRFKKKKKLQYKLLLEKMEESGYYEGSEEEFHAKVVPYWEKFGIRPDKKYFQYYSFLDQEFNPRYIPDDLYYADLYRFLNDTRYDEFLDNKLYTKYIFPDVKQPKLVTKFVKGFFINDNDEVITKDTALKDIENASEVLIKPSDSLKGIGIKKFDNESRIDILNTINEYMKKGDFIVQEVVKQSSQMSSFNESSVNTIRVITLLVNNKVEIVSAIVRIGKKDSFVDNYAQGGKVRPIDIETGNLKPFAVQNEIPYYKDENGNDYESETIIGFDKVKEIVKLHSRIPHLRVLGWDIAIDENDEPILIEINGYVGDNQREDGPAYKEFTEQILTEFTGYKNNK